MILVGSRTYSSPWFTAQIKIDLLPIMQFNKMLSSHLQWQVATQENASLLDTYGCCDCESTKQLDRCSFTSCSVSAKLLRNGQRLWPNLSVLSLSPKPLIPQRLNWHDWLVKSLVRHM